LLTAASHSDGKNFRDSWFGRGRGVVMVRFACLLSRVAIVGPIDAIDERTRLSYLSNKDFFSSATNLVCLLLHHHRHHDFVHPPLDAAFIHLRKAGRLRAAAHRPRNCCWLLDQT